MTELRYSVYLWFHKKEGFLSLAIPYLFLLLMSPDSTAASTMQNLQHWWKMLSFASLLQPCLEALSGKILHCRRVSLVIYIFRVNFVLELFGVDFSWYLSILLADPSALVSSYVASEHWSTKLQLVLSSNFKPHQFQCKACLFSVFFLPFQMSNVYPGSLSMWTKGQYEG